jgi:hypothetical protein
VEESLMLGALAIFAAALVNIFTWPLQLLVALMWRKP